MAEDEAGKILVVDDEPDVREIIRRWLVREGYTCRTAADANEALDCLRRGGFALVVSDIMMPGLSGLDLLERVGRDYPDVAVVMVTALDDRDTAVRALELGAYGYVIKPFERNELLIAVVNALERRRLTLQSRDYERLLEEQVRERTAEVREREAEIVLRLISASEYRDDETGAHIRRIGLLAEDLARVAGWKREDADRIRLAAPMHDVGKIGVPDNILLKPGALTPEEFEVVKRHTEIGARILGGSSVPLLRTAADIALCHHERWDGTGYPRGLAGEDIPEAARIVAVVDMYDALTSHRVYRPALRHDEAIEVMRREHGGRFDPRLFACFESALPGLKRIREEAVLV